MIAARSRSLAIIDPLRRRLKMPDPRPRFYCPAIGRINPGELSDRPISLDDAQARHALRVLRLRPGDDVVLFDGAGRSASGELAEGGRVLVGEVLVHTRPATTVDVAAAMPKAGRADDMVHMLSQVGVDRFIPLITQRSVVEPGDKRVERYKLLAIESAKQCGRAYLLEVTGPMNLEQVLDEQHDVRLIAQPQAHGGVARAVTTPGRVLILIGPEGGWTDDELALADRLGAARWQLGPHVMRIETAAVAAGALARYLFTAAL